MTKPSMKPILRFPPHGRRLAATRWLPGTLLAWLMLMPSSAHASLFKGETLDTVADVMTWVVLFVAPIVGIVLFLLVHILPEKVAGLLWPIAWLWAYSKPVLYKLAYGTDKVAHGGDDTPPKPHPDEADELRQLRQRVAELEARLAGTSAAGGGKA